MQTIPGGPPRSFLKGIVDGPDKKGLADGFMEGKEVTFITNDPNTSDKIVLLEAIRRADDTGNAFLLEGFFAGSSTKFRAHYLLEPQEGDDFYKKGQIEW